MKEFIVKEYETFPYKNAVNEMPELIRCKDCKHYREPNDTIKTSYCWYHAEDVNPEEDYCSWAEEVKHETD